MNKNNMIKNSSFATRRFEPDDLLHLKLRPEDAADLQGFDLDHLAKEYVKYPAFTITKSGQPIIVYGAMLEGHSATIWAITSIGCEECFVRMSRQLRSLIRFLEDFMHCHRIQALVHIDNLRSLKWLRRIADFQVEGLLRKTGENKQDRFILARINPKI